MKITQIILLMTISSLIVGCNKTQTTEITSTSDTQSVISESISGNGIYSDLKLQDEQLEIIDIDDETYNNDVEPNNLMDNLKFTVDVIDLDYETDEILGTTATLDGYSGKLVIHMIDLDNRGIEIGKTYVIETLPMISMTNPPDVTAVEIVQATEEDIDELENIREQISNYAECIYDYNNMEPDDIIEHANKEYGKWTQWEILKYLDFLDKLGYNEGNEVKLRENLHNLESEEETDGIIEITYIAE